MHDSRCNTSFGYNKNQSQDNSTQEFQDKIASLETIMCLIIILGASLKPIKVILLKNILICSFYFALSERSLKE